MLLPICDQTQPYFVTLKPFNLGLVSFVVTTAILSFSIDCAWAQQSNLIKPDHTLGVESSVIKPNVEIKGSSSDLIEGGASQGVNLFHSFEEFNIGEGNRVYFNNPSRIERIFSRVTGHHQSVILGTLGVLGNADLFLLNPNGIIFGQNSALDLKGSFFATTASSVVFEDGTEFSAVNPSPEALLTVSIPIGLQFRETPGAIVNQSQTTFEIPRGIDFGGLKVQPNKTLALVGGDITLQGGFLTANGGRIEVGSVGSPAIVSLKPIEKGWMLGYEGVQNFRDIQLIESSTISPQVVQQFREFFESSTISPQVVQQFLELLESSPQYSQINANGDASVQEIGDVQLQGRRVILADGSRIFAAANTKSQSGGSLTINASESVEIMGNNSLGNFALLSTSVLGEGEGGNIVINTKKLLMRDLALIISGSFKDSTGGIGDITINASESVEISNDSGVSTQNQGSGDAGDLRINTRWLYLSNNASLDAETLQGQGGNIILNIQDTLQLRNNSNITTNSNGMGNGGNITINSRYLFGAENSDITANSSGGRGGAINITATGVFGLLVREELTSGNDITAFSEKGAALNGIIDLNTPEVDPSQGLIELPTTVVDPTELVAQNPCQKSTESQLTITGRGGLPPNITEDLNNNAVQVDLVKPVPTQNRPIESKTSASPPAPIEPAQGWIFNEKGEVVLTAYNLTVTEPQRRNEKSASCSTP